MFRLTGVASLFTFYVKGRQKITSLSEKSKHKSPHFSKGDTSGRRQATIKTNRLQECPPKTQVTANILLQW
jgi:hypothetical protein